MTRLVDVAQEMGLRAEVSPFGRWVRFRGEQGLVYVAEAAFGQGYYTWCDTPHERTAEPYLDPTAAIQAGLQRAARRIADEEAGREPIRSPLRYAPRLPPLRGPRPALPEPRHAKSPPGSSLPHASDRA